MGGCTCSASVGANTKVVQPVERYTATEAASKGYRKAIERRPNGLHRNEEMGKGASKMMRKGQHKGIELTVPDRQGLPTLARAAVVAATRLPACTTGIDHSKFIVERAGNILNTYDFEKNVGKGAFG